MALELWLLSIVSFVTTFVILTFIILIFIYLSTDPYPNIERESTEDSFLDPRTSKYEKFPLGLTNRPSVELSVIIPAYNEELRLPKMLEETLDYLDLRKKQNGKFSYEIIIVDDGSIDRTSAVALDYCKKLGTDMIRVLTLMRNRGKGAAVRLGMLSARGRNLLFADADGATKFADVEKLEDALSAAIANHWHGGLSVICGSRAHLEAKAIAERHPLRNLLMYGFRFCVWITCVRGVRDTQCGFKLFSREAARLLFHNLHVERWAFDVDLLYLARHFDMQVVEIPVRWHEIEGSKIVPFFSWMQMAKDLFLIRLRYSLGAWKIERVHI